MCHRVAFFQFAFSPSVLDWPDPDPSESRRWGVHLVEHRIFNPSAAHKQQCVRLKAFQDENEWKKNYICPWNSLLIVTSLLTVFPSLFPTTPSIHRFWEKQTVWNQKQSGSKDLRGQREEWLLRKELLRLSAQLRHENKGQHGQGGYPSHQAFPLLLLLLPLLPARGQSTLMFLCLSRSDLASVERG